MPHAYKEQMMIYKLLTNAQNGDIIMTQKNKVITTQN